MPALGFIFPSSLPPWQVQIIRKDSQSHDPVEVKRLQSGLEVLGYRKAPIHETLPQSPGVPAETDELPDGCNFKGSKSKGPVSK